MTDHGKKGTFFIKNEKFGKEATVDFPKVFSLLLKTMGVTA